MSAFVSRQKTIRVHLRPEELPCLEKEEWVEVRPGLSARALLELQQLPSQLEMGIAYLKHIIVAWSFDCEVTAEAIEDLDVSVLLKLQEVAAAHSPFLRSVGNAPATGAQ